MVVDISDNKMKWIIKHFKNTKNDVITQKIGISHSTLHRLARKLGLKKTKQFQRKCQLDAAKEARKVNEKNNWPPKGYIIPGSEKNRFKPGISIKTLLGEKKNTERVLKSAESRRKTIASEKRRVLFGLDQKTKLKVIPSPPAKIAYRYYMKKRGYVFENDSAVAYYNEKTNRSSIVEKTATNKYKFKILEKTS